MSKGVLTNKKLFTIAIPLFSFFLNNFLFK